MKAFTPEQDVVSDTLEAAVERLLQENEQADGVWSNDEDSDVLVAYQAEQDASEAPVAHDEATAELLEQIAVAAPAQDAALVDWDSEMQAFVRGLEWGHFTWSWKRSAPTRRHGVLELTCPYHKLNTGSLCKKTIALQSRDVTHRDQLVLALKHWANQALQHTRQRFHILPYRLDLSLTPPQAVVEAQQLLVPPVLPVKTDLELDAAEAQGYVCCVMCCHPLTNCRYSSQNRMSSSCVLCVVRWATHMMW